MFQVELVEGKDKPCHIRKEHDEKGKTVGLSIHLTQPLTNLEKLLFSIQDFVSFKASFQFSL